MSSKHWRRSVPFVLAAVLFLVPAASRAAVSGPGVPAAQRSAPALHWSAPAAWLRSVWQALSSVWATADDPGTGGHPGTAAGAGTNGDSGNTIDPHG